MWLQEHSADSPSAMYRFSVILWLNKLNNSYTVSSLIGLLLTPQTLVASAETRQPIDFMYIPLSMSLSTY